MSAMAQASSAQLAFGRISAASGSATQWNSLSDADWQTISDMTGLTGAALNYYKKRGNFEELQTVFDSKMNEFNDNFAQSMKDALKISDDEWQNIDTSGLLSKAGETSEALRSAIEMVLTALNIDIKDGEVIANEMAATGEQYAAAFGQGSGLASKQAQQAAIDEIYAMMNNAGGVGGVLTSADFANNTTLKALGFSTPEQLAALAQANPEAFGALYNAQTNVTGGWESFDTSAGVEILPEYNRINAIANKRAREAAQEDFINQHPEYFRETTFGVTEAGMNAMAEASSDAVLNHDTTYQQMMDLWNGAQNENGIVTLGGIQDILSSENGESFTKWIEQFDSGVEVMEKLGRNAEVTASDMRRLNAEVSAKNISNMKKYGSDSDAIAATIKALGGNARESSAAVHQLINQMSTLDKKMSLAKKVNGKSGSQLGKKELSELSSVTKINSDALKQM